MNTKYNPADEGAPFNRCPHRTIINDITDEDRQRAQDRLESLIDATKDQLRPLSAEE